MLNSWFSKIIVYMNSSVKTCLLFIFTCFVVLVVIVKCDIKQKRLACYFFHTKVILPCILFTSRVYIFKERLFWYLQTASIYFHFKHNTVTLISAFCNHYTCMWCKILLNTKLSLLLAQRLLNVKLVNVCSACFLSFSVCTAMLLCRR